ncbi:MAG: hypothetical protein K2M64_03480 [Clostridia bacterium]|nr:hypothetical protein [Clostridia bacterium]
MKRKLAIIALLIIVSAVCVSLVACGNSFSGEYKFSSLTMTVGKTTTTVKANEAIEGTNTVIKPTDITLKLNKDNTFVLQGSLFNQASNTDGEDDQTVSEKNLNEEGTWEEVDGKIFLTAHEQTIEVKIEDKTLTLDITNLAYKGGTKVIITFTK